MRKALSIALGILVTLFATAAAKLPDTVTIGEAAKKQAPVKFDHAKHATKLVKTCDTCHHTNKGLTQADTKADVKKCSACHLDAKGKVPSMRDMSPAKNPFHIRCVGCHKTDKTKKAPVACTGCHKK